MRIAHCCLAAFYIDDAGYQENLLPKAHAALGHDVRIIASTENYLPGGVLGYVPARRYKNADGIDVVRLSYHPLLPHRLARKLRAYAGLSTELEDFQPDVIFLHDIQFLDATVISEHKKRYPHVRIIADGHTDFINSARNWLSRVVLHGIVYRWCAAQLIPVTEMFWGVTPLRAEFMRDVYGIPREKVGVLPMGYDDLSVDLSQRPTVRSRIRRELGISEQELVIITGGRIDRRKNIIPLIRAMSHANLSSTRLIVFGSPTTDMASEFAGLQLPSNVSLLGWMTAQRVQELLLAADVACFPGTHSVVWEQAVGVGLPCIVRQWRGFEHLDIGGNCLYLVEGSETEITSVLSRLVADQALLNQLRTAASSDSARQFRYTAIAERSVLPIGVS